MFLLGSFDRSKAKLHQKIKEEKSILELAAIPFMQTLLFFKRAQDCTSVK